MHRKALKKKGTEWIANLQAFSSIKQLIFSLQFSSHFWEKTFWWTQRENTRTLPFIFLSPHPTKHTLKKFSAPKFSIHPISPSNKHTLEVYLSGSFFHSFSLVSSRQNYRPCFDVSHLYLSLNFLHNLIKQALEIREGGIQYSHPKK